MYSCLHLHTYPKIYLSFSGRIRWAVEIRIDAFGLGLLRICWDLSCDELTGGRGRQVTNKQVLRALGHILAPIHFGAVSRHSSRCDHEVSTMPFSSTHVGSQDTHPANQSVFKLASPSPLTISHYYHIPFTLVHHPLASSTRISLSYAQPCNRLLHCRR